jgi:hypothetical protein
VTEPPPVDERFHLGNLDHERGAIPHGSDTATRCGHGAATCGGAGRAVVPVVPVPSAA